MEEGSLRCDANISLRPVGSAVLGTKTELKNMNSFRFIERGIRAELARQEAILRGGGEVVQETLHFDPRDGADHARCAPRRRRTTTATSPSPTSADRDHRGDARARAGGDAGAARRARRSASRALGLTADTARQLAWRPELGDFFEAALAADAAARPSRWPTGSPTSSSRASASEDPRRLARRSPPRSRRSSGSSPGGRSRRPTGSVVLDRLVAEGGDPAAIVEAEGLGADEAAATSSSASSRRRSTQTPTPPSKLRGGNMKAIGAIIGHVMRETKGRADGARSRGSCARAR